MHKALLALITCLILVGCGDEEPTLPPRPTVIVVTASGPYYTSFDEPGDWITGSSEISSGVIEDGRFVMSVDEPGYLAWTRQNRVFGEGTYQLEATFLGGSESSAYGLLMLGADDLSSFLYFVITADGRYDIGFCQEGCDQQESLIGGYVRADALLTGYETNRLRTEYDDGAITFIVNGTALSQLTGFTQERGLVGLIGESSSFGALEVGFDELSVVEE